jgi:hypothetical protein
MDLDWLISGSQFHRVELLEGNTIRISPAEPGNECAEKFLQIVERAEARLGPGSIAHRHSSSRDAYGLDTVILALPESMP